MLEDKLSQGKPLIEVLSEEEEVTGDNSLPLPSANVRRKGRLTVREDVCYEPPDGGAMSLCAEPYSLEVEGADEPVQRKFVVNGDWKDLPLCWAEEWESCSCMILHTLPAAYVPPTGNLMPVVELGVLPSREEDRTMHDDPLPSEPIAFSSVPVGMPLRIYPVKMGELKIRCIGGGSARCQLIIVPS